MYKENISYYKKHKIQDRIFDICNFIVLSLLVIITLYPFWNTVALSFNDGLDSIRGGIKLWPRVFTFHNYKAVFATGTIWQAFKISVSRTILQTCCSVFLTTMLAYALSRREYMFRKPLTTILVLSMYIDAGMIPAYFLMRHLHLINTYWVYILPNLLDVFNFIIVRTYIRGLPESIIESAKIDGAGDFKIFFRIVMPLCLPVLATIGLFVAVYAWNSWFDTFMYTSSHSELHSLQYKLMEYLNSSQNQSKSAADIGSMAMAGKSSSMVTPVSLRAAITVVAAVPILIVYPFVQRYFVLGIAVGGVKE